MMDKKKPDQSEISLAPLIFEETLKGQLAIPPTAQRAETQEGRRYNGQRESGQ
jgi:hypothetical protein